MTSVRPPVFAPEHESDGSPFQDQVESWLQPEEPLLGIVEIHLSDLIRPGLPRKYRRPKPGQREPGGCFMALFVLFESGGLLSDCLEEVIESLLGRRRRRAEGDPFVGGWESRAGEFVIAVRFGHEKSLGHENNRVLLAYTDRRVLVFADGFEDLQRVADLPRQLLGRMEGRRTGKSVRMDLHFADGSSIALDVCSNDAAALNAVHQGYAVPRQW